MISGISIELLHSKKELFDKASSEFSVEVSLGDLPNKITKTSFLSMLTLLSNSIFAGLGLWILNFQCYGEGFGGFRGMTKGIRLAKLWCW